MKVVVMFIASPGFEYECMRHIWLMHWQEASRWLGPDAELWFLHGRGGQVCISEHDKMYKDVDESFIPGILDKTMLAFRDALHADTNADVVIRTNLSSFYMWRRLAAFLKDIFLPSGAWVAGYSPDASHFSGCNMILSGDAVRWLVDRDLELDRTLIDDLAISRLFTDRQIPHLWVPRFDIVYDDARVLHNARAPEEVFHVRIKRTRRDADARTMYDLMVRHRVHPDFLI